MVYEIISMGNVLSVFDDHLVIGQKGAMGFLTRGNSGEKTIYYRDITSIQFKETGMTSGYMEFSYPGAKESRGVAEKGENKFMFAAAVGFGGGKKLNADVLEVKNYIEKRINEFKNSINQVTSTISAADEILKFKALLDSGVLTKEEFEKKKYQLLGI